MARKEVLKSGKSDYAMKGDRVQSVNWNAIEAMAAAVGAAFQLVLIVSVLQAAKSITENRKAREAEVFLWMSDRIQVMKPDIDHVISLPDDVSKWSDEDFRRADRVGICFQDLAFLVENRLVGEYLISSNWGFRTQQIWKKIRPAVEIIRKRDGRPIGVMKSRKIRSARIDLERYAERLARDPRFVFLGPATDVNA